MCGDLVMKYCVSCSFYLLLSYLVDKMFTNNLNYKQLLL